MPYSYSEGKYTHYFPHLKNDGSDIYFNDEISKEIERNLLTMATSRSGKGVTQIIPNLLRWSHNALVIDPKGEAAEATAETREAMGQAVHVLDPFNTCNVAERFRARLNLLDEISPDSPHSFRQLNAMADGLVMRHSAEAGHWDGGTQEVLAGFMAHVISDKNFTEKNMVTVRKLLTEPDLKKFGAIVDALGENDSCGRLPLTASGKLTKTGTESAHFISGAVSNTKWLDDPLMQTCLSDSTFKLSDLKTKPTTIYLVLPFDALNDYGRFLRLFVRMALFHMMQKMPDGSQKGERCLFILDEFFSLGMISEIQKSVGGLPSYNLHLWPFLQDYNQLVDLYGKVGAGTFFANSDWTFLYGVDDPDTAQFASQECGLIQETDLNVSPPLKPKFERPAQEYEYSKSTLGKLFGRKKETAEFYRYRIIAGLQGYDKPNSVTEDERRNRDNIVKNHQFIMAEKEAKYQDEMNQYAHAKATVGKPRIQPNDVMAQTARYLENIRIARASICLSQGAAYSIRLNAYFEGG